MAALQIFDKLLQFPLFQGMSRDDLELVAGHTRFGFMKVEQGRMVVAEGTPSTQLYFLINGTVKTVRKADDKGYSVVERMSAPYLFQPETIMGYQQRFTADYSALTDCNFITISKEEVVRLSEDFLVFRLNLINLYATAKQKSDRLLWSHYPQSLQERVVRFFVQHCSYPAGHKTFYILMTRLAEELNDSRLNVSRALNALHREGKVSLHRGRVEIPQLENLLM